MENRYSDTSKDATENLVIMLESACETVEDIRALSRVLDENLQQGANLNKTIGLLERKRTKVDILRDLATEIRIQLRISADGRIGVDLPEDFKPRFTELMADLRQLIDEEARLESLICGRGLTISRGAR